MDYIDKNRARGFRRAHKALISAKIHKKITSESRRIAAEIASSRFPILILRDYQDQVDDLLRRYHKNEGRNGRQCYDCGPNGACSWCVEGWYAKFVRNDDAFDFELSEWEDDPYWRSYDIGDMQDSWNEECYWGDCEAVLSALEAPLNHTVAEAMVKALW